MKENKPPKLPPVVPVRYPVPPEVDERMRRECDAIPWPRARKIVPALAPPALRKKAGT